MTEFYFLRPAFFLLLIPLIVIMFLRRRQRHEQQNLIRASLLDVMTVQKPQQRWFTSAWALFVAGIMLITGLAGPALPYATQLQQYEPSEIIVVGLSPSLLADDLQPNRLTVLKQQLSNYLTLSTRQTAMVFYSDQGYLINPYTDDHASMLKYVAELSPNLLPTQGSDLLSGIRTALELAQRNPNRPTQLTLIADQLTVLQIKNIVKVLDDFPGKIRLLTVGTEAGSVIQLGNQQLLRDAHGQLVVAKTPIQTFKSLAKELNIEQEPLQALNDAQHLQKPVAQSIVLPRDLGYWLMIPALCILLLFKRGYVFVLVLCALPYTHPVEAKASGYELYAQKQYTQALPLLEDPVWKGNTYYRLGQYPEALLQYNQRPHDANALYNKGNTLAHLGKLREAIIAYTQALALEPTLKVAMDNRNLVTFWLHQQQLNSHQPYVSDEIMEMHDASIEQSLEFMKNMPDESGSLLKKRLELQYKTKE